MSVVNAPTYDPKKMQVRQTRSVWFRQPGPRFEPDNVELLCSVWAQFRQLGRTGLKVSAFAFGSEDAFSEKMICLYGLGR